MACVVRGGVVDLGHVSSPRRPSKQFLNAATARRERAWAQQAATYFGAAADAASPLVTLSHSPGQSSLALLVSQRIAAARAVETRRRIDDDGSPPLFLDPYAELLAGWRHGPVSDSHSAKETGASPKAAAAAEVQQQVDDEGGELQTALDIIATAHVDRLLLNATAIAAVNRITQGDYRQVVLLGDAMDTRPYRLPLAPGTAIFMVAPAEAHAAAAAALASEEAAGIADAVTVATEATAAAAAATAATEVKTAATTTATAPDAAASTSGRDVASASAGVGGRGGRSRSRLRGPRPPPGCLLRRVSLELQPGGDFSSLPSALEAAGFLPDRLSVWAVQGLAGLGLSQQDVTSLLAEAAHCAAYHSLLLGELPPLAGGRGAAANALAECGLLGAPLAFGTPDSSYGRWRPEWGAGGDSGDGGGGVGGVGGAPSVAVASAAASEQRWLFAAQQIRLSAAQMDTFEAHRAAAEETDEDFFDNFS